MENGYISAFDGDMVDYQKWLLAKDGLATMAFADKRQTESADAQLNAKREQWQNTTALDKKCDAVKRNEMLY